VSDKRKFIALFFVLVTTTGTWLGGHVFFTAAGKYLIMAFSRNEILRVLNLSKSKEMAVSIKLRHQDDCIVTSVEDLVNDIVVVKPVNLHGVSLPRTSFYLDEIETVKSMGIFYNAPLYVHLRTIKSNLKNIQERIAFINRERIES
jgi:hypothetical protein